MLPSIPAMHPRSGSGCDEGVGVRQNRADVSQNRTALRRQVLSPSGNAGSADTCSSVRNPSGWLSSPRLSPDTAPRAAISPRHRIWPRSSRERSRCPICKGSCAAEFFRRTQLALAQSRLPEKISPGSGLSLNGHRPPPAVSAWQRSRDPFPESSENPYRLFELTLTQKFFCHLQVLCTCH